MYSNVALLFISGRVPTDGLILTVHRFARLHHPRFSECPRCSSMDVDADSIRARPARDQQRPVNTCPPTFSDADTNEVRSRARHPADPDTDGTGPQSRHGHQPTMAPKTSPPQVKTHSVVP